MTEPRTEGAAAFRPRLSSGERAPFDRLVARLLAREVDAGLWRELASPALRDPLDDLAPGFAQAVSVPFDDATADTLDEEFARLFLLPGLVPARASRWLTDDADSTDDAARPSGTGPASRTAPKPADTIATLLDRASDAFGSTLDPKETRGALAPDHAARVFALAAEIGDARDVDDRERRAWATLFAAELLGKGWQRFGRALEAEARHPLYRMLGALVHALHPAPPEETSESTAAR